MRLRALLCAGLVSVMFAAGCGDTDNSGDNANNPNTPDNPSDNPSDDTPGNGNGNGSGDRYPWSDVLIKTENHFVGCEQRFLIHNDGSYHAKGCGVDLNGELQSDDFAKVDQLTRTMLDRLSRQMQCFNEPIADMDEDTMVRVPGSKTYRTVHKIDENGEVCYRGDADTSESYAADMKEIRDSYLTVE